VPAFSPLLTVLDMRSCRVETIEMLQRALGAAPDAEKPNESLP
jgi:hypothetical protein